MKIRNDYVTNSSATGYVVCVPTSFNPDYDTLKKMSKDWGYIDDIDPSELDEHYLEVSNLIEEIQRGKDVYQWDCQQADSFYLLAHILEKFILATYDIHSDGDGMMLAVSPKKIEDIFMEFHKINITKVVEGGENVTTEDQQ